MTSGIRSKYRMDASRISADAPLGALRGIETFLQLVQQNTNTRQRAGFSGLFRPRTSPFTMSPASRGEVFRSMSPGTSFRSTK